MSEVIDNEAVIMDLRNGTYFSATGSGALIWSGLEAGCHYDQILRSLSTQYQAAPETLRAALDGFLAELFDSDLIEHAEGEDALPAVADLPAMAASSERGAFEPPVLAKHTDMQDLLLLDPIHDVEEAGWPTRKA